MLWLFEDLLTHCPCRGMWGVNDDGLRSTQVNSVDYIEWGRKDSEDKVQTLRNVAELRVYTKETGKIFRNTFDQEGGNVCLETPASEERA